MLIRELVDRYHAAINTHDWDLLRSVFSEDAIWEAMHPVNLRFDGCAAILDGLRKSVLRQELLVQSCAGVVIEMTSDVTAEVNSTLVEFGLEASGGKRWTAVAFYSDQVRKEFDTWRFTHRKLKVRYLGDLDLSGQIFALPGR